MRFTLGLPPFAHTTGRGVVVAVVDSGIQPSHPHIGDVSGGVCLLPDGTQTDEYLDRIGHGTAVAAAIHEKAPDAGLLAVRVFDRALVTNAQTLARGIEWSAARGARLINLSLGTANAARAPILGAAVATAVSSGALVVAACEMGGKPCLPGSLPGVAGVLLDWSCARDELEVLRDDAGGLMFVASGYPRPIPGVPVERNLSGISFAVANVTGFLARLLERETGVRGVGDLAAVLGGGRVG